MLPHLILWSKTAPRLYPLFFDVRNDYQASIDYATWMSSIWKVTDFASCKVTAGTGDVTPLDQITFPVKKMSATTVTRTDTAIADIVTQALAHGCMYVCLNYEEAVPATTILGYWESDQPTVVAAGLKCVCCPTASVLNTIMANASLAARMIAVTEFIYIQTQAYQTNPNDGSYYTNISAMITTIRTRTASMPILIQVSTEKPTSAIPAAEIISQAESLKNSNLKNGGFAVFASAANWAKAQTVFIQVKNDVKKFST